MIGCGAGAEAMKCRFVPPLLAHVNLLLMVSAPEAGLPTGGRVLPQLFDDYF